MPLQDANPTPSFGGFGVRRKNDRSSAKSSVAVGINVNPRSGSSDHCTDNSSFHKRHRKFAVQVLHTAMPTKWETKEIDLLAVGQPGIGRQKGMRRRQADGARQY